MPDLNAVLQEVANGVIYKGKFYPYRVIEIAAATPSYGVRTLHGRFYVRSVTGYVRLVAADTTTFCGIGGTLNKEAVGLFSMATIPSVASAQTVNADIRILLDVGTSLTYDDDAAPTDLYWQVTVAEVDDLG